MDLYNLELHNLDPIVVVNVGTVQNSLAIIKFDKLGWDTFKTAATGVMTSTKNPDLDTLEYPTSLFKDGHTGPDLATATTSEVYSWLNNIPDISKNHSGVSGTSLATQVAFTPGFIGTESYMVVNTSLMNNEATGDAYNGSVLVAFDDSLVDGNNGTVFLYPTQIVTNVLSKQYVALVGARVTPTPL